MTEAAGLSDSESLSDKPYCQEKSEAWYHARNAFGDSPVTEHLRDVSGTHMDHNKQYMSLRLLDISGWHAYADHITSGISAGYFHDNFSSV